MAKRHLLCCIFQGIRVGMSSKANPCQSKLYEIIPSSSYLDFYRAAT